MTEEKFEKAHNVRETDCCAVCVYGSEDYDCKCYCGHPDAPRDFCLYWHNICDKFVRDREHAATPHKHDLVWIVEHRGKKYEERAVSSYHARACVQDRLYGRGTMFPEYPPEQDISTFTATFKGVEVAV